MRRPTKEQLEISRETSEHNRKCQQAADAKIKELEAQLATETERLKNVSYDSGQQSMKLWQAEERIKELEAQLAEAWRERDALHVVMSKKIKELEAQVAAANRCSNYGKIPMLAIVTAANKNGLKHWPM